MAQIAVLRTGPVRPRGLADRFGYSSGNLRVGCWSARSNAPPRGMVVLDRIRLTGLACRLGPAAPIRSGRAPHSFSVLLPPIPGTGACAVAYLLHKDRLLCALRPMLRTRTLLHFWKTCGRGSSRRLTCKAQAAPGWEFEGRRLHEILGSAQDIAAVAMG